MTLPLNSTKTTPMKQNPVVAVSSSPSLSLGPSFPRRLRVSCVATSPRYVFSDLYFFSMVSLVWYMFDSLDFFFKKWDERSMLSNSMNDMYIYCLLGY